MSEVVDGEMGARAWTLRRLDELMGDAEPKWTPIGCEVLADYRAGRLLCPETEEEFPGA